MTYTVSSRTLNPSIPYHLLTSCRWPSTSVKKTNWPLDRGTCLTSRRQNETSDVLPRPVLPPLLSETPQAWTAGATPSWTPVQIVYTEIRSFVWFRPPPPNFSQPITSGLSRNEQCFVNMWTMFLKATNEWYDRTDKICRFCSLFAEHSQCQKSISVWRKIFTFAQRVQ